MSDNQYGWYKRWSNSSLTTLQACGEKFRLRYLVKDRRPVGFAAKRGLTVHKIALEAHKRQMAIGGTWTGAEPLLIEPPGSERSKEEARDLAATQFEKAVTGEDLMLTPEEKSVGFDAAKARVKDVVVDMAEMYVGEVAPPIIPVAVERRITIQPKDIDITLLGDIDLVAADNGEVIRDLKTKEKAPFEREADISQQLTIYHLLRMADTGVLPRAGRLVHLVRTPKTHKTSVVVQDTTRDHDDIKRFVHRINTAVEAVHKGVFVPADPAMPGSPCSWCEYADGTCVYVKRRAA